MTDTEYQDTLNNFRTEIRLTAQEMGLREKAEEMGIHFTTLYRILGGQEPSLRIYLQICEWINDTNGGNLTLNQQDIHDWNEIDGNNGPKVRKRKKGTKAAKER